MKALLFILAVAFGLLALASRKHLNRTLDPDDDDQTQVEQTIKQNQTANQNLNYALNRIATHSNAPVPQQQIQGQGQQLAIPRGVVDTGQVQSPLTAEINQIIRQMQDNPDIAYTALERGLGMTTGPDQAAQRLSLFQAALGIPGNESTIKDIAMREITSNIVDPQTDSADPTQMASLETKRMIVSTAYKLYLNASKDAETTFADTQRALSYQRDQSTKELITYDCLSRFPELRERLMNH